MKVGVGNGGLSLGRGLLLGEFRLGPEIYSLIRQRLDERPTDGRTT